MNWAQKKNSQGISLCSLHEIVLKTDKIARGKPCIFDENGIKSVKIARGKPCILDEIELKKIKSQGVSLANFMKLG